MDRFLGSESLRSLPRSATCLTATVSRSARKECALVRRYLLCTALRSGVRYQSGIGISRLQTGDLKQTHDYRQPDKTHHEPPAHVRLDTPQITRGNPPRKKKDANLRVPRHEKKKASSMTNTNRQGVGCVRFRRVIILASKAREQGMSPIGERGLQKPRSADRDWRNKDSAPRAHAPMSRGHICKHPALSRPLGGRTCHHAVSMN